MVTRFDQISDVPSDGKGYWISKMWLKGMLYVLYSRIVTDQSTLLVKIGGCWNPRCMSHLRKIQRQTILNLNTTSFANIKTSHLIPLPAGKYLWRSVTSSLHETRDWVSENLGHAVAADLVSILETTADWCGTLLSMRCPYPHLKGK